MRLLMEKKIKEKNNEENMSGRGKIYLRDW